MLNNIQLYCRLMRMDKPIGIFLLLWPTLMALWIASNGNPNIRVVLIFVLGTVVMRSAGCVINDIADKHFDKAVSRTKQRPLAAGLLARRRASILFLGLLILALLLVLQLNFLTQVLSLIALFLAILYPFMKRHTHLPQLFLGAAYGFAIPMAFTALTGEIPRESIILFFAMFLWTVAYDTEYAMVDRAEDIPIGVKSTAILFGQADRLIIFSLQVLMLLLLTWLGSIISAGLLYYIGLITAAFVVIYQQYLIKDRNPNQCFKAFLSNNILGAILFFGLWLDYIA